MTNSLALPKPIRPTKSPKRLKAARKPIRRGKRPRKARKTPLGALKRQLWTLFAKYVKDRDGNRCFTCDAEGLEGRNWHAGHLVSARKASTRFDPENVFSQCGRCNIFLRGNVEEFSERYIRQFGLPKFTALLERSRTTHQWTAVGVRDLLSWLEEAPHVFEMRYAEKYGALSK